MTPVETTVGIVVLVGLAAMVMRFVSGDSKSEDERSKRSASEVVDEFLGEQGVNAGERDDAAPDEDFDGEFEDETEAVAITSDGWAFVPADDEVQLVPPGHDEEAIQMQPTHGRGVPVNPRTGKRVVGWNPGENLRTGDLIAARVKRGAPDFDPWRLEALGRDHEYRAWAFETEDAARAALTLLESRIVRVPLDADGDPAPPGDQDFAAAKQIDEETERALDAPDE